MRGAAAFLLILCAATASAFSPAARARGHVAGAAAHHAARGRAAAPRLSGSESEGDGDGDASYSIDWDTAWQKELSARETGTTGWRPEGREPVTETKLAEAKISKLADDAQANLQVAAGDWKLWVGVLAVISVATALAGHMPSGDGTYSV